MLGGMIGLQEGRNHSAIWESAFYDTPSGIAVAFVDQYLWESDRGA